MHSSLEEEVENWRVRHGPEVDGPCSEWVSENCKQVNSGFSLAMTLGLFDDVGCWMVVYFLFAFSH